MNKARLFSIFALIVTLSVLMLVGCEKRDNISKVSIKDHDAEVAIEMTVGNFDFGAYTVVVTRESGKTEEITLTEEMIEPSDLFKFYKEGEHDVTIVYGKKKCSLKISVKRMTFGDLSLPQNNVFTYDGNAHTVEVQGDIPANASVTYVGGNSFVNAGTYDVIAVITCDGYVTVRLSTTVKIERAKFDMSGVKFESREFVYDGQPHSVELSGTLPEGVPAPTYVINEMQTSSATDVGEYKVTVGFLNTNPNYEPIPSMEATLTITPAEYVLDGVEIVFKRENGKTIDGAMKIYDGSLVSFDLNDYSKLHDKISVSFSVLDESGEEISTSNKNTGIVNAGVYTVMAKFTLEDGKNYKPIDPIVCEFEITKAKYDVSEIHFDNDVEIYDEKAHSLYVAIPADHVMTVDDVRYEYYLDGELLLDEEENPVSSVVEVGEYTVKAIFAVKDENYEPIGDLVAILRIEGRK